MTRRGMRRAPVFLLSGLLAGTLCLIAQSSRDAYRNAYRAWREADPSLELDARIPGATLAARAAKAADLASSYGAAHTAALRAMADLQAQNLQSIRANAAQPLPELAPAQDAVRFATRETNLVNTSIAAFVNDPDPAIQRLRQAFEREQAALEALKASVAARQQAEDKANKTVAGVNAAQQKALQEYTFLSSSVAQAVEPMNRETAAWSAYYPKLAEAARTAAATASPPVAASASVSNVPASTNVPTSSTTPPQLAPPSPSITALPLSRYVGVWSFQAGSLFHGSEPEVVDVTIRGENGHATGTLSARFKIPRGATGDPVLRFTFSGDFQATRNQVFALRTAEGAAGSVELIPGGPFNVLEVNFDTEVKPGKVHQADVLLTKQ